jgi:hypothetical protein
VAPTLHLLPSLLTSFLPDRLTKRWKNCLADTYLEAVNDGRSAVYFWADAQAPAACVASRHGRLGWGLDDAKGPENADLPPARLEEIHRAFAAAGMPRGAALEAIAQTGLALELRQHHRRERRRRRNEAAEFEEMYEQFEAA